MNILNDLNIPPDPPETWQAKLGRLVKDYILPYGVPYIIPLVLGWKLNRQLHTDPEGATRIASLQTEVRELNQKAQDYRGHATTVQKEEREKLREIYRDLDSLAKMLTDRQDIFCSPFKRKESRHVVERQLREFVVDRSYEKDLHLYRGVEEILEHDKHCGNSRQENGCLMWVYMELWRIKARLKMQENVLSEIKDFDPRRK